MMAACSTKPASLRPSRLRPKALGPRPVSLEAILVLGAFVVAGLIWLAVGAAVMRSGPKPGIRPVHQVLPRAAAGEDLEHLL